MRRRSAATVATWVAAGAILAFLIARADRGELAAALASADLGRFALASAVFAGVWLALDALVLSLLFSRLCAETPWSAMVRLRGATYLLLVASVHMANAALVGLLHRRSGAPLARLTTSLGVLYAGDLAALSGVSFLASLGASSPILAWLRPVLAALALASLGLLAAGVALGERARGRPFLGVVAELRARDAAALVGLRAAFYGTFVLFVWLTLPGFGIGLPLGAIAARMPVVMAIAALPVTPSGLGTTQGAMLALFGELADGSRVLAYSLVYGLALVAFRLPIGALLAPGLLGSPRARSRETS